MVEALTKRKTVTVNDKLILPYSHSEVGLPFLQKSADAHYIPHICYPSYQAITARDSMAKSLYSALFDWIVLRINHALLNKKDMEESIPVRDHDSCTHTTAQTCQNIPLSLVNTISSVTSVI